MWFCGKDFIPLLKPAFLETHSILNCRIAVRFRWFIFCFRLQIYPIWKWLMKMKKNLIKIFIEKLRIYFITQQVYKQIVRKYLINTFQSNHRHKWILFYYWKKLQQRKKGKYFISMSNNFYKLHFWNCPYKTFYLLILLPLQPNAVGLWCCKLYILPKSRE